MTPPVTVLPDDAHNQALVANVHPADWPNPEPQNRYNLVVIGRARPAWSVRPARPGSGPGWR